MADFLCVIPVKTGIYTILDFPSSFSTPDIRESARTSLLTPGFLNGIPNRNMKKALLVLLLVTSCLRSGYWVDELRDGNYSIVKIDRYPYTANTMRHPTKRDELIAEVRKEIEEGIELLPVVTEHFFPGEESRLRFKYKFTSIDEERNRLILRYFARISYPTILAGYQYQFVVNLKNGRLEQILLSEVPLER